MGENMFTERTRENLTVKAFITFLACLFFTVAGAMGVHMVSSFSKTIDYQKMHVDYHPYRDDANIMDGYRIMKNAFDEQKQSIINAYNAQVRNIQHNRNFKPADFYGLSYNSKIFKTKVNESKDFYKNIISVSSKNQNKNLEKIFKSTDRKIILITDYYNKRIKQILNNLKNNKNYDLHNLEERGSKPDNVTFMEKDFNILGDEVIISHKGENIFNGFLMLMGMILAVGAGIFICFGIYEAHVTN